MGSRLIAIWLAFVMLMPALPVGSAMLRPGYAALPVMLFWACIQRVAQNGRLRKESGVALVVLAIAIVGLSAGTFWGVLQGREINGVLYVGLLKPFFLLFLWALVLERIDFRVLVPVLGAVLAATGIFAVAQVSLPDVAGPITKAFFSGASRTSVDALFGDGVAPARATSVFESPVYAGAAFVVGLACCAFSASIAETFWVRLGWVAAAAVQMVAGLATTSSMFFMGVTVLSLSYLVFVVGGTKIVTKGSLFLGVAGALTAAAAWIALVTVYDASLEGQLAYQLDKIISLELFDSRYGSGGRLEAAFSAWQEYALVGVGASKQEYFVGDSLYLVLSVRFGIAGLLGYAFITSVIIGAAFLHRRNGAALVFCVLITLSAVGLGAPVLWVPRFGEVVIFFFALGLRVLRESGKRGALMPAKGRGANLASATQKRGVEEI